MLLLEIDHSLLQSKRENIWLNKKMSHSISEKSDNKNLSMPALKNIKK